MLSRPRSISGLNYRSLSAYTPTPNFIPSASSDWLSAKKDLIADASVNKIHIGKTEYNSSGSRKIGSSLIQTCPLCLSSIYYNLPVKGDVLGRWRPQHHEQSVHGASLLPISSNPTVM
ncbi:hypothetical protein OJAV_G00130260 [Oryzias javanicus]|uniref:Uncharacterized protein n=1 Tax=Oryzias javanicus TaxID=123683 RepID=A0A437CQG8_ORYJA|nr:hypothetical protein OJAV_G00130260 [Oryzias javanicus]